MKLVNAVDHRADSGIFIPKGAFAIIVKINARVSGFDKRLRDNMLMAVIYSMLTSRKFILWLNPISVVNFNAEFCSKAFFSNCNRWMFGVTMKMSSM